MQLVDIASVQSRFFICGCSSTVEHSPVTGEAVGSAPISRAKKIEKGTLLVVVYIFVPMDTLLKANVFFFVTTISVAAVTIAIVIVSYYAIRTLEQARSTLKVVEEHVGDTTEDVKDLILDLRESTIFRFLFRKKRKIIGR